MKHMNQWNRSSITFKFTSLVVLLIIIQSCLVIGTMIVAGVLSETEKNALESFEESVNMQKEYLFKEMRHRWTNIDPYIAEISRSLPANSEPASLNAFFQQATPTLISMLRTTMTNGVFIILEDEPLQRNEHIALYYRDYEPLLNDESNTDITCIAGAADICQQQRLPLNEHWSQYLQLTPSNEAFYEQPASVANLTTNAALLGYWSKPFQLHEHDVHVMTYSMPIYDTQGTFRGVVGVEMFVDNVVQYLPGKDLFGRDDISFLLGYEDETTDGIMPLVLNGAVQKSILPSDEPLSFERIDDERDIYVVDNQTSATTVYSSIQPIEFYMTNTPFEREEWYLIGLKSENKLFGLIQRIENILLLSLASALLIGVLGSYFIARLFTRPIVHLAHEVATSDIHKATKLRRTGVSEIDHLSSAIEHANKHLLDSTMKLSQIIKLVDVPLAAFEYKHHEQTVFMTDQLGDVLQLKSEQVAAMRQNKQHFIAYLQSIQQHPEREEQDVYKLAPNYWVRIKLLEDENRTLGVVMNVTQETLDKIQIKLDRDHDTLTQIFNRGAYSRHVKQVLAEEDLRVSACVMFDLDFLKHVNDTFGHKWGDTYIAETARHLRQFSEDGNIVGRISGDEFSVFMYGYESKEALLNVIQRFYDELDAKPIVFPTEVRTIKISGGVYLLHDSPSSTFDDMIQKADSALYEAKRMKKGSWVLFNEMK